MSAMPVALITGTNSGVGLALAVKMAATHRVFATMRGLTAEKAKGLNDAVSAAGVADNVEVVELDVASDESVKAAVAGVLEKTEGRIDVLVNNAGYSLMGTVEMVKVEDVKAQFDTNVFGVIRCQQAVLPAMRKQRSGKIINMSSVGGVWGQPFNDVYCATKFALEGMAESQAALFRTFGVYVTNVQPGSIQTAFVKNVKVPDMSTIPSEYQKPLQTTMAAFQKSGATASQTPDEVAQVIIDEVVAVEQPPLKVQPNEKITTVFEGQLTDTTGEWGVKLAADRFL